MPIRIRITGPTDIVGILGIVRSLGFAMRRQLRLIAVAIALTAMMGMGEPGLAQQHAAEPIQPAGHAEGGIEMDDTGPARPGILRRRGPQCPAVPLPGLMPSPAPGSPSVPPPGRDTTDPALPPSVTNQDQTDSGRGGALASGFAALPVGDYIDSPLLRNMFRVRYEQGFGINRPDRAEYFYAAWRELSFHPHGMLNQPGFIQTNRNRGLDPLPASLDHQELSAALELVLTRRVSIFVEVPFRTIHLKTGFNEPDGTEFGLPPNESPRLHDALEEFGTNFGGLSDIVSGLKFGIVEDDYRALTFQLRTFFPSGNTRNGAGTGHFSIEPALLHWRRLGERASFQSQVKAWIPLDGSRNIFDGRSFAGNILIYGMGLGYDLIQRQNFRVSPVAEFVGWTVLNGFEASFGPGFGRFGGVPDDHGAVEVAGTTVINAKLGVRTTLGRYDDIYIGFGHALTTARWYRDLIRVEYRRSW